MKGEHAHAGFFALPRLADFRVTGVIQYRTLGNVAPHLGDKCSYTHLFTEHSLAQSQVPLRI